MGVRMHHFDGHHQSLTIKQSTNRKKTKQVHLEKYGIDYFFLNSYNSKIYKPMSKKKYA